MRFTPSLFRIRTLTALGGILLIVAACSSAGASSAPSAAPSAAGPSGDVTVAVASGTLGSFLTGANGLTLYTFSNDSANTTTCVDKCAATWPPLIVASAGGVKSGDGVTMKLATISRPDGTLQVTYNGIPLYYFATDKKAGDTNGQGVGGKWFVAAPSGTLGSPAPSGGASSAPSSSDSKGGNY